LKSGPSPWATSAWLTCFQWRACKFLEAERILTAGLSHGLSLWWAWLLFNLILS
jgi:hypothetical protein